MPPMRPYIVKEMTDSWDQLAFPAGMKAPGNTHVTVGNCSFGVSH